MIIAIDPGERTGICIMKDGNLVLLTTLDNWEALTTIASNFANKPVIFAIENPNRFNPHTIGNEEKVKSRLRGSGSVQGKYTAWVKMAKTMGWNIIDVSPREVGSGYDNPKVFVAASGYKSRCSKNARDAYRIAEIVPKNAKPRFKPYKIKEILF